MNTQTIFDIAGIGIGPFNLGLAALCHPVTELKTIFLDQKSEFNWHQGMMIPGTSLQVSYLADLVTLADPSSKFTYLNFLRHQNRLIQFGIHENSYITRSEYNRYCRWVCGQMSNLHFNNTATAIKLNRSGHYFEIRTCNNRSTSLIKARHIVIGTGPVPYIPGSLHTAIGKGIIHSSVYMFEKEYLLRQPRVTIVGSGQSAAEIFYDMISHYNPQQQITWITRSSRLFTMEQSKFCYEMTSPEYIDFFYGLTSAQKISVLKDQNSLYKGINHDLIRAIYDKLYFDFTEDQNTNARILPNICLDSVRHKTSGYEMSVRHGITGQRQLIDTDGIILATGFEYKIPDFLSGVKPLIQLDANNKLRIHRNYSLDSHNRIFVQNTELHTHGFNAADLGLGAYRNAVIINSILKRSFYPVDQSVTFQTF